jgi:hypothetical protein
MASALFTRRMLICVFTGFASGLPLYLLINLLPAWLRSEHVDLKAIGLFALIQLPAKFADGDDVPIPEDLLFCIGLENDLHEVLATAKLHEERSQR